MSIDSNISLIRGETKILKFQRWDGSGSVITTIPDEMFCSVKDNYDDNEYMIQKTYTGGGIKYNSTTHYWYVVFYPEDTVQLPGGHYVIDIMAQTDSGNHFILRPQPLTIIPSVTMDISPLILQFIPSGSDGFEDADGDVFHVNSFEEVGL